MVQKYYSVMTTNGTNIVNNLLYEDAETLFTDGWNISLGTGNLEPTSDTTELINPILDKNSVDYPDITFGKHEIYGHYAEITIPESIKGNILTECGLFNDEGILIAVSKIYLDLTETTLENGIDLTAKQRIYIQAVPSATNIIYTPQGDLINKELLNLELKKYQKLTEKGVSNGYCPLDENAIVPIQHLPELNYANMDLSNLSATGEAKFANKTLSNIANISDNAQGLLNEIYQAKITGSAGDSSTPCYMSGGSWYSCSGLSSSLRCSSRTTISSTKPDMVIAQGGSGTSGYRVWSSGFKECWGSFDAPTTTTFNYTVTFSMGNYSFSNVPMVLVHVDENGHATGATNNVGQQNIWTSTGCLNGRTTSSFTLCRTTNSPSGITRYETWYAFGY